VSAKPSSNLSKSTASHATVRRPVQPSGKGRGRPPDRHKDAGGLALGRWRTDYLSHARPSRWRPSKVKGQHKGSKGAGSWALARVRRWHFTSCWRGPRGFTCGACGLRGRPQSFVCDVRHRPRGAGSGLSDRCRPLHPDRGPSRPIPERARAWSETGRPLIVGAASSPPR